MKQETPSPSIPFKKTKGILITLMSLSLFLLTSWKSPVEPVTVNPRLTIPGHELKTNDAQIKAFVCKLTAKDVKAVFIKKINRVLVQLREKDGDLELVVYGVNKKQKRITAAVEAPAVITVTGFEQVIPKGAILGNVEFTRGQFQRLFEGPGAKGRKLDPTKITDMYFIPILASGKVHTYLNFRIAKIIGPVAMGPGEFDGNPSPPAKPCEEGCDN